MTTHRAPHWTDGGRTRLGRGSLVLVVALALVLAAAGVATAFFTATGSDTGSATSGTLTAPTAVTGSQAAGTGDVTVSWTASTGLAPTGYYVVRIPASGPEVAACGSSTSLVTGTSCTASGVPVGASTYRVVAVFRSWSASSTPSAGVNVVQSSQTIVFGPAPTGATYGGTSTVTATGGASGNPVVFTSATPSVCSVSGTHGATVHYDHAGSCVINANQAGSTYYSAAPQAQLPITIAQATQSIAFTSTAPANAVVDGSGYQPAASSTGSGNAVTFTIAGNTAANCSISGGVVSYLKAGTCTINANKAGNADYLDAPQVQQSFQISPAAQAINFTSTIPANAKVTDTYTVSATGGNSGIPVTFSIAASSSGICSIAGNVVTFNAQGTCRVLANQAGNADYTAAAQVFQDIAVTKRVQTITFGAAPTGAVYNGPTKTVSATATSGLAVTFTSATTGTCTISGSTVTIVAAGDCTINANQGGNTEYAAASQVQQTFTIAKAPQTVTFAPASPANAGTSAGLTATSSSGLTGITFSTSSAASICTVSGSTVTYVGAGTCALTATQAGNTNYLQGSASANVTVSANDSVAPSITAIEPGNESGGWNSIACSVAGNIGRICVTATDNVAVTSVTIKVEKSNGRCFDGVSSTTFDPAFCNTPVALTLSGGIWVSNFMARQNGNGQPNFTNDSYTLTVIAKDAAGNTTTATRNFTVTGS